MTRSFGWLLVVGLLLPGCGGDGDTSGTTPGGTDVSSSVPDTASSAPDAESDATTPAPRTDAGAETDTEPRPSTDTGGDGPRPAADVHRELLKSLGETIIVPIYKDFHAACEELEVAASAYANSVSEEDRAATQLAWRTAMSLWQHAEVFQVGPAGSMTTAIGGQDLRAEIYSWPTVNPCRVDQETLEGAYSDTSAFAGELANVRGLDALEYLLFGPATENGCKVSSSINKNGDWQAALDAGEIPAKRAAYAHALAILLVEQAEGLVNIWEEGDSAFIAELSGAGTTGTVYTSAQEALNSVTDAMFYAEKQTKDMKLATPIGISACEADTCPEDLESLYANHSKENVIANVRAFQLLFLGAAPGTDAPGFDDLLKGVGQEGMATDIADKIANALTVLEGIEGSFADALASNPEVVEDGYVALKAAMDIFKTEFMSALDLEIPNRAAGDND